MTATLAQWVLGRVDGAVSGRGQFESLWDEVTRLCIPREATYRVQVTPGMERDRDLLDTTAPRALELFASFLATAAHNLNSKLFFIRVFDENGESLNEDVQIRQWAEKNETIMMDHMRAARLSSHLHKVDMDLGSIGTGPIMMERDTRPDAPAAVKYMAAHMQNVYLMEDESGNIDTVMRRVEWTAEQWRKRFPDADLGTKLETALKSGNKDTINQKFEGWNIVFPNTPGIDAPVELSTKVFKYAHVWVLRGDQVIIEETGSDRFKYAVPRWYTTRGEVYGRSPAMTVLPEIRMANRMRDTILRAAEKLTDPPIILPDGALVSPLRLFAGGVSFTDGDVNPRPLLPPGASQPSVGEAMLRDTRGSIREGFFVPLFISPDAPVKTATQVLQETDERNRAVAPMVSRMHEELLEPTFRETFLILQEAGVLIPLPEGFAFATVRLEFVSPVIAAQKQSEALGTVRLLEGLAPWAEATQSPDVFLRFDVDKIAKVLWEGSGAPSSIVLDDAKFNAAKKAMQQAREAQAQQSQALEAATVASKFRQTEG